MSVVATSYLLGVSTRRMEKLVETLGIIRLSKSHPDAYDSVKDGLFEQVRTTAHGQACWIYTWPGPTSGFEHIDR